MNLPEIEGAHSHRIFFALWPDAEVMSHLAALGHSLASPGSRPMRPHSLHLTLAFLGSVTSAQLARLLLIAEGIRGEAFEFGLDRLGFWPRHGVLWAGCRQTPPPLRRLFELLSQALADADFSLARHDGGLVPHVTLARRVRCRDLPRLDTPIAWHVDEFALVESHLHPGAASYRTVARFPLAGTDPA
jgi:2'-5' RNA ligase